MNATNLASRLIASRGPTDAYYVAQRHVLGRLVEPTDIKALRFWIQCRNACYVAMRKVGTAKVWT